MGVIHDAVHLEEKAERLYREAAHHTEEPSARILLALLADAEAGHAAVLRDWGSVKDLQGPDLLTAARDWIRGAVEGGAQTLSADSRLLDNLRRAMDLERETKAFYVHHAERATDVRVAEVLGELAKIEGSHYALVSSLVEYYNRPNEWVESAEFGLRPDY